MNLSPELDTPRRHPARPAGGWLAIPQKVLDLLAIPSLFVLILLAFVAQTRGKNRAALEAVTAVRAADGRCVSSRTTLTDLTERKRAEAEVHRLNAELEDRVRARFVKAIRKLGLFLSIVQAPREAARP